MIWNAPCGGSVKPAARRPRRLDHRRHPGTGPVPFEAKLKSAAVRRFAQRRSMFKEYPPFWPASTGTPADRGEYYRNRPDLGYRARPGRMGGLMPAMAGGIDSGRRAAKPADL